MKDTKFNILFLLLPDKDKKRFIEFLNSPFHNNSPRLSKLGTYFHTHKKTAKEEAFAHVYGSKRKYSDILFRRLMNGLLEELKKFISVSAFLNDKVEENTFLLKSLKEMGQEKMLDEVLSKQTKLIASISKNDSSFYYKKFLLETEKYEFNLSQKQLKLESQFSNIFSSLEDFYLFNKLKYYCHALNQKNIIKADFQVLYKEEILKNLKEGRHKSNAGIMIYYYILLLLLEEGEESNYKKVKKMLRDKHSLFVQAEARDMLVFIQNYCIRQINKGLSVYLKEIFYLYQFSVEKKLVYENGYISPQTFKNIVSTALRLKKGNWAQEFIRKYASRIVKQHSSNSFNYNMANVYYSQKKYGACLKLLQQVNFKEAFYGLDAKVLFLKTFYEQGDYEALDRFWFSFYMYVKRNRYISDAHKTGYLNFLKFTRKLMVVDESNVQKLEQLKIAVQNTKPVSNINWLLEMLEEKMSRSE